jgi:hypothetical protein
MAVGMRLIALYVKNPDIFEYMKMADLMREVASLPKARQAELAAFLLHLRLQQNSAWKTEMTRRIDDSNPANWVSLQDCKTALSVGRKTIK